jgi:asparagine synthase (glutamine-hydrolysing)
MCGIAGFIDTKLTKDTAQQTINAMLHATAHRGPDDSSSWVDEKITLGHNRLSIIDLSETNNQPFVYADVIIVFNGEVYNYIELRKELETLGFAFTTHGDTEVICAAYKAWGIDCARRFMGMWSFSLWDKTQQQLFCCRDRFGIKPFYFTYSSGTCYFASEYKAFKAIPGFDRSLNENQLRKGLGMKWVSYYHQTFYNKLSQLLPGHYMIIAGDKMHIDKYWSLDFSANSTLSKTDKKEAFFELFKNSMMLHSRSDVRNGMCLSGGLDSSAIASMHSVLFPETRIKSFTIFYEGKDTVDERPFVKEVINKYGNIEPHYFTPGENDLQEHFHHAAYSADVPLYGSSYLSQYFLMKLAASEQVKVVLDGQGSDEYLGGYLHSFYRLIGSKLASGNITGAIGLLHKLKTREGFGMKKAIDFFVKGAVSAFSNEADMYKMEFGRMTSLVGGEPSLEFANATEDKFNNFLNHLLFSTTLQTLLHHEDRNSMAFSIESRVPFLDHRLVEFAFSLDTEDKISAGAETKYILREGLKPILPKAIYERKDKKGFVTPGEVKWLNGPLKHLLDIDYSTLYWMNAGKAKALVEAYKKGDTSQAKNVWAIANTAYWIKHFA